MTWSLDRIDTAHEATDWARCGAMALTGPHDGPPVAVTGAPASLVRTALARVGAGRPGAVMPGVEVLGERAALTGLARRAPWSVGGYFRTLPALDGWVGISLARESDRELVPALVQAPTADPWAAVGSWLRQVTVVEAEERLTLLGLPGAGIPPVPRGPRRAPVLRDEGGPRRPARAPVVIDLTSLWAGPLCSRLLGAGGARVIKVEHSGRLDGARRGSRAFYDLLHSGHESVVLDFRSSTGVAALRSLLSSADVVLEASRPRALTQLGIDPADFVARGVVWLSITAYGRRGEDGLRVGFGDDVAAAAGLIGWHDGAPCPVGDAIADPLAGVVGAACVTDAIAGDRGCLLDLSMYDVAAQAASLTSPLSGELEVRPPWVGASPTRSAAEPGADTERVLADLG